MASKQCILIENLLEKHSDCAFTPKQIAELLTTEHPEYIRSRKDHGKKSATEMQNQITCEIYTSIAGNKFSDHIKISSDTPKKLSYTNDTECETFIDISEDKTTEHNQF